MKPHHELMLGDDFAVFTIESFFLIQEIINLKSPTSGQSQARHGECGPDRVGLKIVGIRQMSADRKTNL